MVEDQLVWGNLHPDIWETILLFDTVPISDTTGIVGSHSRLFALHNITAPPNCDSIPFTTQILEEADNKPQVANSDFYQFDHGENTGMILFPIALLLN